jgi:SAM-dependent methyltransferase
MQKQVDKSHYAFSKYITKQRWASMWHQLDEVLKLEPKRVLEVGPGPGVFKAMATLFGVHVETLDIDPELKPDHVASVFDMPFEDSSFDVVCAFQMLEHLPFDQSLQAFREMSRVASRAIVMSLPDADTRWPMSIYLPKVGPVAFSVPRPRLRRPKHVFDGEHHWEIGKAGCPLKQVVAALAGNGIVKLDYTFRVHEHPYHRFFVFSLCNQ